MRGLRSRRGTSEVTSPSGASSSGEEHENSEHYATLVTTCRSHYAARMRKERVAGRGRLAFGGALIVIAALVAAQSVVHLVVVLHFHRMGTFVDLDRSNGLPDIVSTIALALAALAAGVVARRERGFQRVAAALLAAVLTVVMLADLFHDGAHPSSAKGWNVIVLVAVTAGLLGIVALVAGARARGTLVVAVLVLASSFFVTGLDRLDHRFERARGEKTSEYEIVAKEGLELLGWSLVALALWDEAFRRRPAFVTVPTARASRAEAPSRRRAA